MLNIFLSSQICLILSYISSKGLSENGENCKQLYTIFDFSKLRSYWTYIYILRT